ncbi:amidohydrolase [Streptomyces sp. NPDC054861]
MRHADLVLLNGTIWTASPVRHRISALAVTGGRITALGTDREVREHIGPRTEVTDLGGRFVQPGFTDAHVHPVIAGIGMLGCDLSADRTAPDYRATIAAYAAAHPGAAWIQGSGWSFDAFPGGLPHRDRLDDILPDRPAYFPVRDGHSAWVNSRALAMAGVDRHTPDPADGRIERDATGEPTGVLHEGAMTLVGALVPPASAAEARSGLLAAQELLHSLGITGWQDALVGTYAGFPDPLDTYLACDADGSLTARVRGALWWERDQDLGQIDSLLARREKAAAGRRFTAGSVKIMQDGVVENFSAAMLEPYLDSCGCPGDNAGISMVDPAVLRDAVIALDGHGFQIHFHALGDRAVREALNSLEAAVAAHGHTGLRHHLAHLQVVHPDDIPRFRTLRAAANMQPLWAAHEPAMDELTLPFLGEERGRRQYPFAALHAAGAVLAAGSDWFVSSPDPWHGIHVAVNRQVWAEELGEPDLRPPFLPEQRLALSDALAAYTAGSAWVNHQDDAGVIALGRLADLAVLDRDPFAIAPADLHAVRTVETYVGGVRVYSADGPAAPGAH